MSGAITTVTSETGVTTTVVTKPGWKTTEFWGKVIIQVIGLLVLLGVIHPVDLANPATQVAIQYAGGIAALVAPEVAYAFSRAISKLPIKLPG